MIFCLRTTSLSHLAPLVNLLSKYDVGMGKESHAPPVMRVLLSGVLMVVFFKIKKKYICRKTLKKILLSKVKIFSST